MHVTVTLEYRIEYICVYSWTSMQLKMCTQSAYKILRVYKLMVMLLAGK